MGDQDVSGVATTALIVEDDPALQRAYSRELRRQGVTVSCCATRSDALQEMSRSFDIYVFDLDLGTEQGEGLAERACVCSVVERGGDLWYCVTRGRARARKASCALLCEASEYDPRGERSTRGGSASARSPKTG